MAQLPGLCSFKKKLYFNVPLKFIAMLNISLLFLVINCFFDHLYLFYFNHFTVAVPFASKFRIDYSFMSKPAFSYGFMETYHKVLIMHRLKCKRNIFYGSQLIFKYKVFLCYLDIFSVDS